MAHCGVTPRQGNVSQVSAALETSEIGDEKFATPNLSISAVARSVEGDTNYFLAQVILRHAACNVSMMVLHPNLLRHIHTLRESRTHVSRMQIKSHGLRLD